MGQNLQIVHNSTENYFPEYGHIVAVPRIPTRRGDREPITLTLRGYAVVDKVAQRSGSSARVYVPHDWIGKRVRVVCLDP